MRGAVWGQERAAGLSACPLPTRGHVRPPRGLSGAGGVSGTSDGLVGLRWVHVVSLCLTRELLRVLVCKYPRR